MLFPLSSDKQLAPPPVDVINLYGHDFGHAQTKPGHQHEHCMITLAIAGLPSDPFEDRLDFRRWQISGKPRVIGAMELWYGQRQIGRG